MWDLLLLIVAIVLVVLSIKAFVARDILMGVVFLVLALLVGPGGVSVLT